MFYRSAKQSDIDSIMEIEKQAFIEGINEMPNTFLERIDSFSNGFKLLIDENYHCNVIGYYCSEIWDQISCDKDAFMLNHSAGSSHKESGDVLYISSIAIKNQCKNKGYGKKLFYDCTKSILNSYPGIKDIVLLVNEEWKEAIHIYKKYGFKQYGVLDGFFPTDNVGKFSDGLLFKAERNNFLG